MIAGVLLFASLAAGPVEAVEMPVEKVVIDTSILVDPDHTRLLLLDAGGRSLKSERILIDRSNLQLIVRDKGEESLIGPGITLEELMQGSRGFRIERVFDPLVAGPILERYSESPRLRAVASRLQQPEFRSCSQAARAYDVAGQSDNFSAMQELGPEVDTHCLQSLLRWRRSDGEYRSDPIPSLLDGSERSGLAALAILERVTARGEVEYVCGGLLRPGNRVLTAAHCFGEHPAHSSALRDGRLRVRLARDPLGSGWPVRAMTKEWRNPEPVRSDAVELEIVSAIEIDAPPSEFVAMHEQSEPIVLGYFRHFDTARQIEGDTQPLSKFPAWFRGLRWSRSGLCHAINAADRCVRLLCQTINGYSGSPVFDRSAYVPGQPLRVLGLVSRPDHSDAACGAFLEYSTLAFTEVGQL
jgi:V8-like Glu-specific endopeptidase